MTCSCAGSNRVKVRLAGDGNGSVGQVHECGRNMSLLDGRMNVLSATAAHAINEIGVVVGGAFSRGAGFDLIGDPSLIRIVSVNGEIAVRAVEDVADGVGLGVLGAEGRLVCRQAFCLREK